MPPASNIMHHLFAWVTFLLFLLLNAAFTICRNFTWRCSGLHAKIRRPGHVETGGTVEAHRMNIWFKHIIDIAYPVSLRNFILTHQDFVKPEYVLRDTVTLLQVTKDTAIFIEGKKGMPPAFSMSYSFATIGQMATGKSIIVMPLPVFLRLSEKMEKLTAKTVFLYNTARCGGTLVTNILERTGRVVAWNEPRVLDNIAIQAKHAWNRKTSKLVLQAAIKMLTKPFSGYDNEPLAYVIKLSCACGSHWRMFHDVASEATKLFLYRDLNATAESLQRVVTVVPSFITVLCAAGVTANPHALPAFLSQTMFTGSGWSDMPVRYNNVWEWSYRLSLINLKSYLDMRQNGIHIDAFKYEDLLVNTKNTVTALLKADGIPKNLVARAIKAMEQDSQANVPFSQKAMAAKKTPVNLTKLDSEFLDDMQEEFAQAGVPGPYDWIEGFRLPGTVNPEAV